jgi:hypothetical protein
MSNNTNPWNRPSMTERTNEILSDLRAKDAAAAAAPTLSEWTERDKYGRSVRHYAVNGKTVCVRVSLPKVYREAYGDAYMVADWAAVRAGAVKPGEASTKYRTLGEANKAAALIVAREVKAAQG